MTRSTGSFRAAGFVVFACLGACSSSQPSVSQIGPLTDATLVDTNDANASDAAADVALEAGSNRDATLGDLTDASLDGPADAALAREAGAIVLLSGLAWASGASSDTLIADASIDGALTQFAVWRGRPLDVTDVFDTRDSWAHIENPDTYDHGIQQRSDFPGMIAYGVAMVPYIPDDAGNETARVGEDASFASCAAPDGGAYYSHYAKLGTALVADGRGDVIVRLGWEANGTWYASTFANAASPDEWKACFRNEVMALRSTAPNVRINWNMNASSSSGNPVDHYPGDDVVDIIGIDFYDNPPHFDSDASWDHAYMATMPSDGGPLGIGAWLAFARSHHKPFAIPEWALVNKDVAGDDPVYVAHMFEFFQANAADLAFEVYFNLSDKGIAYKIFPTADAPNAAAQYESLF